MKIKLQIGFLLLSNFATAQFNLIGFKLNSGNNNNKNEVYSYRPNSSYISSKYRIKDNAFSATLFTEKLSAKKHFFRFNIGVDYSKIIQFNEWIKTTGAETRFSANSSLLVKPSVEIGKVIELENLRFRFGIGLALNYNQYLRTSIKNSSIQTNQSYNINNQQYKNYKPNQIGAGIYVISGIYYTNKTKFSFGLEFTNGINYLYKLTNNTVYIDKIDKLTNSTISYTTSDKTLYTQLNSNLMIPSLILIYKIKNLKL